MWPMRRIWLLFAAVLMLWTVAEAAISFNPQAIFVQKAPAVVLILNEYTHTDRSGLPETGEKILPAPVVGLATVAAYRLGEFTGLLTHPLYHKAWIDPSTHLVSHKASGTGFFIRTDGLIATNNHVVEGTGKLTVEMFDGTQLPAFFVAADPSADIALIRVTPPNIPTILTIAAKDDRTIIGKPVLTIGHPYSFNFTQSVGYVARITGYAVPATGKQQVFTLMADLSVLPGNSGGPLIGEDGTVLGIVFAKLNASDNYGFAIPGSKAAEVIAGLIGVSIP